MGERCMDTAVRARSTSLTAEMSKKEYKIWRPGSRVEDLPPWRGIEPRTRVYFFDIDTREELVDHDLYGMTWLTTEAMAVRDGGFCRSTTTAIEGIVCTDLVPRLVRVQPESFPRRRVAAKIWDPAERVQWRALVSGDGTQRVKRLITERPVWMAMWSASEFDSLLADEAYI